MNINPHRILFAAINMVSLVAVSAVIYLSPAQGATVDDIQTVYKANVIRVIDGDTIEVSVELLPNLTQTIHVREGNLDTPEKRRGIGGAKCDQELAYGKVVSEYVFQLLPVGTVVQIENFKKDKYAGRIVADIKFYMSEGGELLDLGDHLIEQGMAVPYDGGTKQKVWCDGNADP